METVAGIFDSRASAERAVQKLHGAGFANDRIAFLTPGTTEARVEAAVPTTETEGSGMGTAMGGAVGGAIGAATGATLGAAAASLLVPGVGPVIAAGLLGAAVLGLGGAATGMAAGTALEKGLAEGLPHDELFIYEDALRQGHSVVIAFAETNEAAETARRILAETGAESIDAAKEDWWLGLRDVEEENYEGHDFSQEEADYRRGFEAALNPRMRGRSHTEVAVLLVELCPDARSQEALRSGYNRGQAYYRTLQEKYPK